MPEKEIDINALRLPQTFGATLGVRKVLTTVPVGKPSAERFFRTHPSETFGAYLFEDKEARDKYIVLPDLASEVSLAKPMRLHLAVDTKGNPFLIPVPLPREDGTLHPAHQSLADTVERAKQLWIRILWNPDVGGYDVFAAQGNIPDPIWPESSIDDLVKIGFRGKVIDSIEHPIIKRLRGM
jgi:hypothetical protein